MEETRRYIERGTQVRDREREREVVRLRQEGHGFPAIGNMIGISTQRAWAIYKRWQEEPYKRWQEETKEKGVH